MKRYLLGVLSAIFAAVAMTAVLSPAGAATASGNVNVEWHVLPVIHFSLTPNYASGYGSVLATFGTQPTPTHGPGATGVGTGTVDFGTTLSGDTYLYKYAAELTVTTNDTNGFYVYGEAAAALTNNSDGTQYPVSNAVYYLTSSASGDSNTGFTPGLPFSQTGGAVSGGTDSISNPAVITYTAYPAPVAVSAGANDTYYYDYQFKVPDTATAGDYYVWIVYTVVGA
ncbi:MAG TPA: hypothetical protein VMA98_06985 [Candidatus Acidoferrales bacterium]|nr:hypothetical protein [Candidatus Acidoferrales bacterium]